MSANSRRTLLIAALIILAAAAVWRIAIEVKSPVRAACARINKYGYNISPDDLYLQAYEQDMSLKKLFEAEGYSDTEVSRLSELSKSCGFSADIDRAGKIELLMYNIDSNKVMLIYTVSGTPELVFIEELSDGSVLPIG